MGDSNKHNAKGHIKNKYKSGIPVLILLDPSDIKSNLNELDFNKDKPKIDLSSLNSVKMWVVNRIHIYFSKKSGISWEHGRGSFEGKLVEKPIYINDRGELFDQHIFLTKGYGYQLHITGVVPSKDDIASRKNFIIDKLEVVSPESDVYRPYPEDKWQPADKINKKNEIYILKIPSGYIKYAASSVNFNYWQTFILNSSKDNKILEFNNQINQGTADQGEITAYLKSKLPIRIAVITQNSAADAIVVDPGYFYGQQWPDYLNYNNCFFYSETSDVSKASGTDNIFGKASLYWMQDHKPDINDYGNMLYEVDHFDDNDINKLISDFDKEIDQKMMALNEKELPDKLLEKMRDLLSKTYDVNKFKYFNVGIGSDPRASVLMALYNVVAVTGNKTEEVMIDHDSEEKNVIKSYIKCSIKQVFFSKGSDGYSDDVVSKHVFFQLKDWYENIYEHQRSEIAQCDEIEVIGFSSKLTSDASNEDNPRLRKDRAWKTAKSLEMILHAAGKDVELVELKEVQQKSLLDISKIIGQYKGNKQPIYFRGAEMSFYPSKQQFMQYRNTYIEDVLSPNDFVELDGSRGSDSDNRDDRSCLIIFRKKVIDEIYIKNSITSNVVSPIYKYRVIKQFHYNGKVWERINGELLYDETNKKNDYIVLLYASPGALKGGP